jgi:hypothetical protein
MIVQSQDDDAGTESAVTTESEAGNQSAELTKTEKRRKTDLEAIQDKAEKQLECYDEGTIGHSIGEVLDELGGAVEKDEELNEEVGFDVAGNINAGAIHKAEKVLEELKEVLEDER